MSKLVAWLALAMFCLPGTVRAETLRLLTEESPPFNFLQNGQVAGIAVELMRVVAARAGVEISIDLEPWQRAYQDALDNADACVFSTTVTEARRPLFKWVGPLVHNDWAFLARTDRQIRIETLDDARRYVVGVYQGDAREAYLAGLGGFRLSAVGHNDLNEKLLEAGRIDLWASSTEQIWTERQLGVTDIEVVYKFKSVELGAACNRQVPDALIERLNAALDQIRREGLDRAIESKYRGASTG